MPFDRGWAPHIDHEVSQLLLLHAERNSSRYGEYPEAVRRAISCAYAAHFRTLLEFFHDGRPGAKCPKPNTQDLKYSEFVNDNLRPEWSPDECARLGDADKLIGHLSMGRLSRGSEREWGDQADLELLRPYLVDLVNRCQAHKHLLPRTFGAVEVAGDDLVGPAA